MFEKLRKKNPDPAATQRRRILTAMEVPEDLSGKEPILTLTGSSRAVLENYKSILSYDSEKLVVLTSGGKVILEGKRLEILRYESMEMEVSGYINGVWFERK